MIWVLLVLLVIVGVSVWILNQGSSIKVSDDPLSDGIAERWNAALPAGFTKESVEHITDGTGYNFAKLTYETDISEVLAKWQAPTADTQAQFDAVIDAQLADAGTSPEDAALIESARPVLDETWVCFSVQSTDDPNDVILLAYQKDSRVMIVVEQQQ